MMTIQFVNLCTAVGLVNSGSEQHYCKNVFCHRRWSCDVDVKPLKFSEPRKMNKV